MIKTSINMVASRFSYRLQIIHFLLLSGANPSERQVTLQTSVYRHIFMYFPCEKEVITFSYLLIQLHWCICCTAIPL